MDTVLAHVAAPVVVRSVVDQPLLVGAAGVVVVLAILLVFVMVLRSGARRELGVGLDGRQEPYGQPRARASQPDPYGQMSFGQGPYDSQDSAYQGWQPNAGRMPAMGQASNGAWDGAYDNGSMAGAAQQQSPWGAPSTGSRRDEPGWGSTPQGGAWQDQRGWGGAFAGQAQSGWGQAEAPAAAAPWSAPAENSNWAGAGANGQPYAQAGGQSQPYGQGFAAGQSADMGFGQQGGAPYGGLGPGQGAGYSAGYEAPGPAPMGGGGWSAPAAPSSPSSVAPGMMPQGGSSDDRGMFGYGGDMPRAGRSGGGPGVSSGALLVVRVGKEPGRVYEVGADRTTIGRSRESDIFLEDLAVSRNHTSITSDQQGRYILRDEGSANGTLVNNQPVTGPIVLQYGDTIKVGETIMTFSQR